MKQTYEITAWRDDPHTTSGEFEAESPQEALALAKESFLHEFGESCYSSSTWDTFSVSLDGEEVLEESPPVIDSKALVEALAEIGKAIERGDPQEIADKWLSLGVPAVAAATGMEAA